MHPRFSLLFLTIVPLTKNFELAYFISLNERLSYETLPQVQSSNNIYFRINKLINLLINGVKNWFK